MNRTARHPHFECLFQAPQGAFRLKLDLWHIIAMAATRNCKSVSPAGRPQSLRRRFSSYPSSPQTRVLFQRRLPPSPQSARAASFAKTCPIYVFAPAAGTLLPTIADDGVPVAVGFSLAVGGDLERKRLAVFERGSFCWSLRPCRGMQGDIVQWKVNLHHDNQERFRGQYVVM